MSDMIDHVNIKYDINESNLTNHALKYLIVEIDRLSRILQEFDIPEPNEINSKMEELIDERNAITRALRKRRAKQIDEMTFS